MEDCPPLFPVSFLVCNDRTFHFAMVFTEGGADSTGVSGNIFSCKNGFGDDKFLPEQSRLCSMSLE